jgi:hypothetical protein
MHDKLQVVCVSVRVLPAHRGPKFFLGSATSNKNRYRSQFTDRRSQCIFSSLQATAVRTSGREAGQ